MSSQMRPAFPAECLESGPQHVSCPSLSTVTTVVHFPLFFWLASSLSWLGVGLFCSRGSLDDLSGPPHRLSRGVLCGSLADLSGPPRRGPRGLLPRGRLSSTTTGRYQRGTSMAATGRPLRGIGRRLQTYRRCTGCGWHFPTAVRSTAASIAPTRAFSGSGLLAELL